jgi:pilus assembly protein Flp/PilA
MASHLPRETTMKAVVSHFLKDEAGATAIEYGLIAALIAVVIIGALTIVGSKLGGTFNNVAGKL